MAGIDLPALGERGVHEALDAGVGLPERGEEDGGLLLHDAQLLAQRLAPDAVDHPVADLLRLLPLDVGNLEMNSLLVAGCKVT